MSSLLTRETRLRHIILDQYASLRQFAIAADIPHSTLMTLLSRDLGGASFDVVMRICAALALDPRELKQEIGS